MSIFHGEDMFFGPPKVQGALTSTSAYNIIFFLFLMENRNLKMIGSVGVKITPDFYS